jgi:translation initiation factor IF-3
VFDENEVLIGDIKFSDALATARTYNKDLVLRNAKTEPPICKIMNYKMELMKRLFKKLGRKTNSAKDQKSKSMKLTTAVSIHDLENKKRQAIQHLKSVTFLRFFMKVNVYDPENVEKGRMILLNLAEDLKEYSRVKAYPGNQKKNEVKIVNEKKPQTAKEIEDKAESQENFVKLGNDVDDDGDYDDTEDRKSYIYMELESTTSF